VSGWSIGKQRVGFGDGGHKTHDKPLRQRPLSTGNAAVAAAKDLYQAAEVLAAQTACFPPVQVSAV